MTRLDWVESAKDKCVALKFNCDETALALLEIRGLKK